MTIEGVGTFDVGQDPNSCEELVKAVKEILLLPSPDLYITVSRGAGHDLLHVFDDEVQENPIYDPIGSYEIELTAEEKKIFGN